LKKVPDALIVPIAIQGSYEYTRYGSYPLSFGETIKHTVLDPIERQGRSAEEVVAEAEARIKAVVEGSIADSVAAV
jgi:1-acyl-sn-glycerol-3-phosphate acyltransferase